MANLTKFRTATLTIDGQAVPVRVKRLRMEESESFRAFLRPFMADRQEQTLDGDEAATVRTAIETYITVPPGALSIDDEPVVTGAQLLDVIGENPTLVMRALLAISGVTFVSRDERLPSASESVSVPSSGALDPAPDGPRPATTADDAKPAATAPTEGVTAGTERPSSGPTAILN